MSHQDQASGADAFWGVHQEAYAQLVGTSAAGTAPSTCFYFDGLDPESVLLDTLTLVNRWFMRFAMKPRVLLTQGDKEVLARRYTLRTLRDACTDARIRGAIRSVEIFPKGRTTTDDTWFPGAYFGLRLDRPESAFFSVNEALGEETTKSMLLEGQRVTRSCAAYSFLFPRSYSPLGYFWGISVQPSGREFGKWGTTQSRRLSHWRDNTSIGVSDGTSRTFYRTCDGHVRDAYPLMLINKRHLIRATSRGPLSQAIVTDQIGSIAQSGSMSLWHLKNEELDAARSLLENHDISLSGRRILVSSS